MNRKVKTHIVIDGNAFYEIDEECMRKKEEARKKKDSVQKDTQQSTKEH